jgi:hypothetical protein|tara:strand:- start:9395 stop:9613 length:219 start_codon:yes stop_codon:yes gene_type:complete
MKESKWIFKILSMPLGKEGNGPSGLLIPLLNLSQKQRGQSLSKDKDEGDRVYGGILLIVVVKFKLVLVSFIF